MPFQDNNLQPAASSRRPVFLNPLQIRLPVTASVSLAHRISGILLAAVLPFLVYSLEVSLRDIGSYEELVAGFRHPVIKILLVLIAWSLAHHIAAGVRHMFMDAGIGSKLPVARKSAWAVHGLGLATALLAAGAVFL